MMIDISTVMDIRTIKGISRKINDIGLKAIDSEGRIDEMDAIYYKRMEKIKEKHEQSESSVEEWD